MSRSERIERLEQLCHGDPALRHEVESLLKFHESIASETMGRTDDATGKAGKSQLVDGMTGQLDPGTMVSGRYTIVDLIGRGGMGIVYQAHDTVLNIQVALKFFHSTSTQSINRLLNEVRLARRVTHPYVCQVFDVSEDRGRHFIVMEHVRGEDLATLLRRIGRIPQDKVLVLAQQLCQGLAAAHAKGICHRDLKPANIMIDHAGDIKIMDFGIAASREIDDPAALAGGTPAYMAPEQLASAGSYSEQSDVYAVGLVLYEALTGHPAFQAKTIYQLAGMMTKQRPEPPSKLVPGIDMAVDRAIMSAIEPIPAHRPASALHLATMFPGVDALRMAGQAGVTPPADLVAGAPVGTSIHGKSLIFNVLGLCAIMLAIWLTSDWNSTSIPHTTEPPAIMIEQAKNILDMAGYDETARVADYGYVNDPTEPVRDQNLLFWYQRVYMTDPPEMTKWMVHRTAEMREDARLPAMEVFGVACVMLRFDRTVRHFQIATMYPLEDVKAAERPPEPDWTQWFQAAGLNESRFRADALTSVTVLADRNRHWVEEGCDDVTQCREVHAASLTGRPTYFSLQNDIDKATTLNEELKAIQIQQFWVYLPFQFGLFLIALVLAVLHIRRKKCDLRGSFKLVMLLMITTLLVWIFRFGHVMHPSEIFAGWYYDLIILGPLFVWVFYVGFEPLARRHVPHVLIDWNKMLRLRWRDPGIGKSLFAGALGGAVATLASRVDSKIAAWQGFVSIDAGMTASVVDSALKLRYVIARCLSLIPTSVTFAIVGLFFFTIIRSLIHRDRVAAGVFALSYGLLWGVFGYQSPWSFIILAPIVGVLSYVILARRGLLATMTAFWVVFAIEAFPMTTDMLAWYAIPGLTGLILAFAIGLTGLVLSSRNTHPSNTAPMAIKNTNIS